MSHWRVFSAHASQLELKASSLFGNTEVPFQRGRALEKGVDRRTTNSSALKAPEKRRRRVQRYEHPRPGDLLHLDIKGMTRFGQVSLRGDGRWRGKKQHPGFLALHVAVDDHSRLAFTRILPDQKAETTIGFLRAATDFFATHGIGVRALLTDNGSSYRSRQFRQACSAMQICHHRTRPYTPRTNGKAERFIQTVLREWAYAKHWSDSEQRDAHLQPGSTTTTTSDPMVASTTCRPSAAPILVQPLDQLQAPRH